MCWSLEETRGEHEPARWEKTQRWTGHLCVVENHRTAGTPARPAAATRSSPVCFFPPVILFPAPVHWVATMHQYSGFYPLFNWKDKEALAANSSSNSRLDPQMQRWKGRKAAIFRGKLAGGVAERMTGAAGGCSRGVKWLHLQVNRLTNTSTADKKTRNRTKLLSLESCHWPYHSDCNNLELKQQRQLAI